MDKIQVNRIYRHYKGNLYLVRGFATHSETRECVVIYQGLYEDGTIYARPATMWHEIIDDPAHQQQHRFELQEIPSMVQ